MNASEKILEANIRHDIYLSRYSKGVVRKIITMLNKTDHQIILRLEKDDVTELNAKRLKKLIAEIRYMNVQAHKQISKVIQGEMQDLSAHEAGFYVNVFGSALPVAFETVAPTAAQVYAASTAREMAGKYLKDWLSDLSDKSTRELGSAISIGIIEGQTNQQILQRVRGTRARKYQDGIQGVTRNNAAKIVRTATNHIANVAREETYSQNRNLIKGIRWVSTLDRRTTKLCAGRDGRVYELDNGPRPPAHINCRSTTTPVLKSWKQLGIDLNEAPEGTRASMNGQVPATETYQTWLKKQSSDFQDDVLGVTKAKLFRKGGLPLDRFTDASGAEYTLDQLRRREKDVFAKAKVD